MKEFSEEKFFIVELNPLSGNEHLWHKLNRAHEFSDETDIFHLPYSN